MIYPVQKSKVKKLGFYKQRTVFVDLSDLSDAVNNDVVKKLYMIKSGYKSWY